MSHHKRKSIPVTVKKESQLRAPTKTGRYWWLSYRVVKENLSFYSTIKDQILLDDPVFWLVLHVFIERLTVLRAVNLKILMNKCWLHNAISYIRLGLGRACKMWATGAAGTLCPECRIWTRVISGPDMPGQYPGYFGHRHAQPAQPIPIQNYFFAKFMIIGDFWY